MLEIEQKFAYKAFGLTFSSMIHFPELEMIQDTKESLDVDIKINDLSKLYFELSNEPNKFIVKENLVMFQMTNIGIFSIENGNMITVSPTMDADDDQIRLLVLGTCMSTLLMQRGIFPLHGSAVAINGKAYAFIGESGAGKSTIASAFLTQGFKLLSDDVIAISISEDGDVPYVTPSYPQQKLWQDSLNAFGMDPAIYRSIFGRETKYNIPVSSGDFSTSLPLGSVFELTKSGCNEILIRRIKKLESFSTLFFHTFRNFLIPGQGLTNWHFQTSAKILNKIQMHQLQRPTHGSNVQELVTIVLNTINKGD